MRLVYHRGSAARSHRRGAHAKNARREINRWVGRMLRHLALAAALASWQPAAASDSRPARPDSPQAALTRIEAQYADWLDATGAVGTIDSGLMARIDGLDRRTWETRAAEFDGGSALAIERSLPRHRRRVLARPRGCASGRGDAQGAHQQFVGCHPTSRIVAARIGPTRRRRPDATRSLPCTPASMKSAITFPSTASPW